MDFEQNKAKPIDSSADELRQKIAIIEANIKNLQQAAKENRMPDPDIEVQQQTWETKKQELEEKLRILENN